MEHARAASPDDAEVLIGLWERAVAELDGQRGGTLLAGTLARADLPDFIHQAIDGEDRLMALGLIDDVPVGLASVVCRRDRRETIGELELVYVEPGARMVGVAEAMLVVVVEWCSAQDCVGVDAPALPGNRPAKAFFEGEGFLARLLIMHYPLPVPPP